jgi:hypothetical protein
MAVHYYTATVQLLVAVPKEDPDAAQAAITDLFTARQEDAGQSCPLVNWAYLKVGAQALTPIPIK